jgi:DNA-binding protein HU-beta
VNKAELIDAIADRLGADKRAATNAVDAVVDTITRAVAAGEKVAITGFGVFERQIRNARTARNPRTGALVQLKKTAVPKFRAGGTFKEVVSGAKKLAKAAPGLGGGTAKKASPAKKSTAKKASPAKKSAAKKSTAKKSTAKKSTAKKAPAKKSTAKKSTAKKALRRR